MSNAAAAKKSITLLLMFLVLSFLAAGCGAEVGQESLDEKDKPNEGAKTSPEDPENQVAEVDLTTGKGFFLGKLSPGFKEACSECHAAAVQNQTQGPLSIYSYTRVKELVKEQPKVDDSPFFLHPLSRMRLNEEGVGTLLGTELMGKMLGKRFHGGGKQCDSPSKGICDLIREWWILEFGEVGLDGVATWAQDNKEEETNQSTGNEDPRKAVFTAVTSLGKIVGWAVNKADFSDQIEVEFYLGGKIGVGEKIGSVTANQAGVNGGHAGQHQFSFQLPSSYLDGVIRQVYVYGVIDGTPELLITDPQDISGYAGSEAGKTFFTNTVEPKLSGCAGCHTIDYDMQFSSLLTLPPNQGGTASNNELFNKPANANGVTHGGGKRCSNANASPCAEIKQWWDIEFNN